MPRAGEVQREKAQIREPNRALANLARRRLREHHFFMATPSSPAPEHRFSDRVENHVRHRPRYPQEIIDMTRRDAGLSSASVIAHVGSGTGHGRCTLAGCFFHETCASSTMAKTTEPTVTIVAIRSVGEWNAGSMPAYLETHHPQCFDVCFAARELLCSDMWPVVPPHRP